ncbi:MAG: hypothetical protein ACOX69_02460 [Coriobacteriales bacterium]|jgi:hypothetical protein
MIDHKPPFGASCIERRYVGDHLGGFDADGGGFPHRRPARGRISASKPGTWSTTKALSAHDASKPATWSTTWAGSMQVAAVSASRGGTWADFRIEGGRVVDHQGPLGARRIERRHVDGCSGQRTRANTPAACGRKKGARGSVAPGACLPYLRKRADESVDAPRYTRATDVRSARASWSASR